MRPCRAPEDGMEEKRYVIVRTLSAGVFAGTLESRTGREVVLTDARRLWYWTGAASLSELAVRGTKNAKGCKFPVAVTRLESVAAIETHQVMEAAAETDASVPEAKARVRATAPAPAPAPAT